MDMDVDAPDGQTKDLGAEKPKDVKGKQRAIEPEPESPRRQKKKRDSVYTLRPILTIQRSQGFVWNQVSTQSIGIWSQSLINHRICSYRHTSKIDVRLYSVFRRS